MPLLPNQTQDVKHAGLVPEMTDADIKTKEPEVKEVKRSAEVTRRAEEIKRRRAARVPNIKPKTEEASAVFDHKMLEDNLAKMQEQASIVVVDACDEEREFTVELKDGKTEELTDVPALYFKNCTNGRYVINRRVKNLFIQNCTGCSFEINAAVLTRTAEVWRGGDLKLAVHTELKTLQVDMLSNVSVTFGDWNHFHTIVYNQVENLGLTFTNGPEHNVVTGYAHMLTQCPDSNITDQFIVRFVDGTLTPERCIRLKNGHLSTEREAVDWEVRNTRARDLYMDNFMKNAGVQLGRDMAATPKIGRNAQCPCASGRKYKKCCQYQKSVTGLATNERKINYRG